MAGAIFPSAKNGEGATSPADPPCVGKDAVSFPNASYSDQPVSIPVKSERSQQQRKSLCLIWRCYKRQIIWLTLYFVFQIFLFGMGCLESMMHLVSSGRNFKAASLVGIAFGMVLQVNCAIFLFGPALRSTTSFLRKTWVAKFVPFDSWIGFHIIVSTTVGFAILGHVIAMLVSLYQRSQTVEMIQKNVTYGMILSQSGFAGKDFLGYTTISGWVALACYLVIVFFALPPLRNSKWYDAFYWTHKLQLVFWAALIVHTADFWKFLVGPLALYLVEKAHKYFNALRWVGTSHIVEVNLLPGDVTNLVIRRPNGFDHNPGDYCYIKVPSLGILSWHPFTISSCPEQTDSIWIHTKASGNYTKKLRQYFSEYAETRGAFHKPRLALSLTTIGRAKNITDQPTTKTFNTSIQKVDIPVFLDGPYASSGAELFHTEHAVLIGAGIGVTPFMSILGSLQAQFAPLNGSTCPCLWCDHRSPTVTTPDSMQINGRGLKLKKVDFIWVTRDLENIEWIMNLLRRWEELQSQLAPDRLFMTYQIFVTALKPNGSEKVQFLDGLRTPVKSGRPEWPSVFEDLDSNRIGKLRVFYCGPHTMEDQIRGLCGQYNFDFSWENF